jgi:AcrR family transcriptional regulator
MTPQTRDPSNRLGTGGSVGSRDALARRRRSDGEATYRRVLDSAVETILEKGYYQASSNEIARRAGVTWGVIQHRFGSREALMLEVINDRWRHLQELVATAQISGDTLEGRLAEVLDVLAEHYGKPAHLAQVQILLDLNSNPSTSASTREAVAEHGGQLSRAWRPLFRRALGEAASQDDLVRYAFNTLRGYLTGNLIARSISSSRNDRVERALLVQGVAAAIRTESASRGIDLDQSR